ncbi:right-handed parallel beta-helix repeat-containing protein [Aeoliella sp.]|uniref:right-handed parallel beta-helix repeat-containing protein n=1 Tax=Aeoliella sp. TaxID=2795800 RepID=UPI003CCBCEE2
MKFAVLLMVLLASARLEAGEFFVAVDGNDGNPGTIDLPFASIARGQEAAHAGDTVWIRGGVYEYSAGAGASENAVLFDKSGSPGQRINYWAYPGESPVFDFYNYLPIERIRGFSVDADWLHFKGLELRGVQQVITNVNESWAIRVEGDRGNDNIFEQLNLHHNEGPGLFILSGGNNLVLNCDSHHNYDPDRGGENADGFGSHSDQDGNVFVGNRAWENSDDGFDFINSPGEVTVADSWSWRNGYIPGTNTAAGNGAGFKTGGFGLDPAKFPDPEDVPRNVVRNNMAFDNRVQGFYANHHPGGIDWINNTAFSNSRGFDLTNDVEPTNWPADHYLRNNISFANGSNLSNANPSLIDDEYNTWNSGFDVSAADFASLSKLGVDGARAADGSLPTIDLLRLQPGSSLINAGEDQGLPYYGSAPDLGAFELQGTLPGDFNADNAVDLSDYTVWRNNLGGDESVLKGNGDGDNQVTAGDYALWKNNFGASIVPDAPVLLAVADTNIEEHQPNDAEGGRTRIQVRSRSVDGTGRQHVSYIRFDLTNETSITDATFTLVTNNNVGWLEGEVQVYGLNDVAGNTPQDWNEATFSFNASGDEIPGDGDAETQDLGSVGTSGTENLWLLGSLPPLDPNHGDEFVQFSSSELSSFLNSRVGGLATLLVVGANGSDNELLFWTREVAGFEPRLAIHQQAAGITTVPEPCSAVLVLLTVVPWLNRSTQFASWHAS